jgi:S1-C subfamily serine protease
MSDDWYVRRGQKSLGPLSDRELRRALKAGRISSDALIRRGTSGSWRPVSRVLEERAEDDDEEMATLTPVDDSPGSGKSWIPLGIGALAGFVVVAGGFWLAFELGRKQAPPPVAAAAPNPEGEEIEPNGVVAAAPARQAPAPEEPKSTLVAPESSARLVAQRPTESSPAPKVDPSGRDRTAPKDTQSLALPHDSAPSSASNQQKPTAPAAQVPNPQSMAQSEKATAPVAPAAPVIVPKAPAKDADLRALETTTRHSATAKEAAALYHHFEATRTMSAAQHEIFKANLVVWEDRARQNLARLGDKWVPEADAQKAHDEAAQLFDQAYEMVKVLNFPEARRTLEKASRVDPNSIAADFTLGILNSITSPGVRSPQTAARHFQTVLRRIPGYVPALNNLAIAEVRQEKYADAVRHLREAGERSPTSEEVTQNLGRFISEAQRGRLRPTKSVLSDATRFYSTVITTKDGTRAELKFGWRYMHLLSPKGERESLSRVQSPSTESIDCFGQGTGFVIEPHYVLTCRHVVDDLTLGLADKIELIDPTDPRHQRRLPAVCVDVDQEDDLCLLRCDQLNVPAISLADKVPPRGTEILLIGYPGGSWFGLGLKTTRGVVTALPGDVARIGGPRWLDFSRRLWYDAASSHGASGGAVCDEHGNVVAIHALGYRPGDDPSNAKYAGGVPAPYATAFIRHLLPTFARPPLGGPSLKWSDVDAKISPSIVLIVVGYRKVAMVMNAKTDTPRRARESVVDIYDDHVCSVCNGKGRIRCRAPGCSHGGIHDEVIVNDSINIGSSRAPVIVSNPTAQAVRRTCPTCHGTGYVRCPFCAGGYDPLLH